MEKMIDGKSYIVNTFLKVGSSNILGMSYSKVNSQMALLFGHKKIYVYNDVSLDEFLACYNARSIGSHISVHIKGKKSYVCYGDVSYIMEVDVYKQDYEYKEGTWNYRNRTMAYACSIDNDRGHLTIPCPECYKMYSGLFEMPDGERLDDIACKGQGLIMVNI